MIARNDKQSIRTEVQFAAQRVQEIGDLGVLFTVSGLSSVTPENTKSTRPS